jgi:hypothetical protein
MVLVPLIVLALALVVVGVAMLRFVRVVSHLNVETAAIADDAVASELRDLVARKELLMQAIQSTHLDFDTGKIAASDRDASVSRLESEAVNVLRRIDEIRGSDSDLNVALAELDELAPLSAEKGEREWSDAAKARHGGKRPSADTTSPMMTDTVTQGAV